ncbi:FAD-binding oxidoreductase [Aspergillus undulatus]|uniref:FAD-binding oxidoreductase n=1 Tax=Aspergillus undulatus TaxID=1810928 RepID=UPI003CCDFF05
MHLSNLFILVSLWLSRESQADSAIADASSGITSLFSSQTWSPDTVLSFPSSAEFEDATARWNIRRAPSYAAALSVGAEEDVITAVKAATIHNISFLATGGRHGFGVTLRRLEDGLALDLSSLDAVTVDSSAGTVTVGPGVRLSGVFEPVYNAGYQLQTGICTCGVRLVTATGDLLEVSESSNPDLFWAVRGAAHNFGIITEATYQLRPWDSSKEAMLNPGSEGNLTEPPQWHAAGANE